MSLMAPGHKDNKASRKAALSLARHGPVISQVNSRDGRKIWHLTPQSAWTPASVLGGPAGELRGIAWGCGTLGYSTSRAAALPAVCSCGWNGPEQRLDREQFGEQDLQTTGAGVADTCGLGSGPGRGTGAAVSLRLLEPLALNREGLSACATDSGGTRLRREGAGRAGRVPGPSRHDVLRRSGGGGAEADTGKLPGGPIRESAADLLTQVRRVWRSHRRS